MTALWQNLIQQARQSTKAASNEDSLLITPLDQLSVLEVAGDNASTFLQNLLTNDVSALAIGDGHHSGFCNAKGRLIAYFLVIRRQAHCFQLVLPQSVCESIHKRLTMYVLRSKVTITDCSQEIACLGLYASTSVELTGLALNESLLKGQKSNDHFAIRLPADNARWLMLIQIIELDNFLTNLADYQLRDASDWERDDIESGIAKVTLATQEKFTPQQVNLDLNNTVSFTKGCYPGQEVVARLHYLGKPSRRLFKAKTEKSSQAEIGSEIMTEETRVAGHIVNIQDNSLLLSLKLTEIDKAMTTEDGIQVKSLEVVQTED